jgi:hypothetical protein
LRDVKWLIILKMCSEYSVFASMWNKDGKGENGKRSIGFPNSGYLRPL